MNWLEPVTLRGAHVTLAPLERGHRDALIAAVKDGELWKLWYTAVPSPEAMEGEIERRVAGRDKGEWLPFTILATATGQPVGMTNYLHVDVPNRRLEIGATWYRKSVQRSAFNTEAKLMLLDYAFEKLNCIAVEFRTHFFNHQSRRGIERLGAKLDGILRSHQIAANGTLRDTCVYSIVAAEWPTVKAHLAFQLAKPR